MKRPPVAIVVVVLLPVALIGAWIWRQQALLSGPSGGSGVVEGTSVTLSARIAARIETIPVAQGDAVHAGDVLMTLDCAEPEAAHAEALARLEAARAQARAAAVAVEAARSTVASGRAQAAALSAQRDLAKRQAERLDQQAEDIPASSRDQSHASADALSHQASAAAATTRAAGAQVQAAEQQAAAADAQVQAVEAAVARAALLVEECTIAAPRDGLVEVVPWEVGELLPMGMPAVRLVDLRSVTATFYLPNAELGVAEPGRAAEIVADAWPDETFSGTVKTVAATAEFTPRNIQTRTDRDRLVYPVEVVIPNPDGRLRPGMPVQVSLPGTER